jgi:formylglycine-generating enzyme required for sulfatase activity
LVSSYGVISAEEFNLHIERFGSVYRARVRDETGDGKAERIHLPIGSQQLAELLDALDCSRLRHDDPPDRLAAQRFGERLFRALFRRSIRDRYLAALARADQRGRPFRLRLTLGGDPALCAVPWELLYDPWKIHDFIALSRKVHLARSLEDVETLPRPPVEPPLRVLAVIACPRNLEPIDAEEEWRRLQGAVSGSAAGVVPDRLAPATRQALEERLRRDDVHVLHFVGHGEFDTVAQEGTVVLEDSSGLADRVGSQELRSLLGGRRALRLVVLNGCESGRPARGKFFGGVAQSLLRSGVPMVVAMQLSISDDASVDFATSFYSLLAGGLPVDAAMAEARHVMSFTYQHRLEWLMPVLYLQAADGVIVAHAGTGVGGPEEPQGTAPTIEPPAGKPPEDADPRSTGSWRSLLVVVKLALALAAAGAGWIAWQRIEMFLAARRPLPPLVAGDSRCGGPPSLALPFVYVEPGTFVMGANREDEQPPHEVTLSRPFCLGAYEVTQAQWRAVMGGAGPPTAEDGRLPALDVSWHDTQRFIERLNQLDPEGRYRLPTEAEWEYAAQAGTTMRFSFGHDEGDLHRYGNCDGKTGDDRFADVAPVGAFAPNRWGLYDMHGNVWEWVEDPYGLYSEGAVTDPTGPPDGRKRIRRGSSWEIKPEYCYSTRRAPSLPDYHAPDVGFRVARDLP